MASSGGNSILAEADRLVNGPRQATYGHPYDDFKRTAAIWTALIAHKLMPGQAVTPSEVGLLMVGLKLSREQNAPKRDNMVDAAGYAATVVMVREREAEHVNNKTLSAHADAAHLAWCGLLHGKTDQDYPSIMIREMTEYIRERDAIAAGELPAELDDMPATQIARENARNENV